MEASREPRRLRSNAIRAALEPPIQNIWNRLAAQGELDVSALRQQLRNVCAEAKHQGVRVEQVLIAAKEIWTTLPAMRDRARDTAGESVWDRIVALTLDEYFEPSNPNT